MPVLLQVRQVREAIFREAGSAEQTVPRMKPEFGTLFHNGVAELLREDGIQTRLSLLDGADMSHEACEAALNSILYKVALAPYLNRNSLSLHKSTSDVLTVWEAMKEFSRWAARTFGTAAREMGWVNVFHGMLTAEEPMTWELREPSWTESVRLTGIADLVVRIPEKPLHWCVVEFKLGYTSPEADVAQACLYHEMLSAQNGARANRAGSLALVSFEPALRERLYSADRLRPVQASLKDLIGRLARVVRKGRSVGSVPQTVTVHPHVASPTERKMEEELLNTFRDFHAPVERSAECIVGPTFIRFFVAPLRGVRVKAVTALGHEVQVRLQLSEPPIFATGSGGITVDVQRQVRESVPFRSIAAQLPRADVASGSSQLPVGIGLDNRLVLADLADPKHAHILVIGTTGSGKSEWLRTAIAGLILANTPDTLQFVLIDPKRNAFRELQGSAYLLNGKVIHSDDDPVLEVFEQLVTEMEDRYRLMEQTNVDDLRGLVATGTRRPRIVCICDEYGDLVKSSTRKQRADMEHQFVRLGAKARAAGIHLILATQEARRETIRGTIDANLPARVALKVRSDIESRLILGEGGAEKLLGQGDLLFKDVGAPVRLQAPYMSKEEREEIFSKGR